MARGSPPRKRVKTTQGLHEFNVVLHYSPDRYHAWQDHCKLLADPSVCRPFSFKYGMNSATDGPDAASARNPVAQRFKYGDNRVLYPEKDTLEVLLESLERGWELAGSVETQRDEAEWKLYGDFISDILGDWRSKWNLLEARKRKLGRQERKRKAAEPEAEPELYSAAKRLAIETETDASEA